MNYSPWERRCRFLDRSPNGPDGDSRIGDEQPPVSAAGATTRAEISEDDLVTSGDHVTDAIASAKRGDLERARNLLGLSSDISDDEVGQSLFSVDRARIFAEEGRSVEAVKALEDSWPVMQRAGNESAKFAVRSMSRLHQAVAKLYQGDSHGAGQLLDELAAELDKASFHAPQLEQMALLLRLQASAAAATTSVSAGDVAAMSEWMGRVRAQSQKVLSVTDSDDPSDAPARLVAYYLPMELASFLGRWDLMVLDFDSMKDRLDSARSHADEVEKLLADYDMPLKRRTEMHLRFFRALSDVHGLAHQVIRDRASPTKERAEAYKELLRAFRRIEDDATAEGEPGRGLSVYARDVRHFLENLLAVDANVKKDFGKWGGLVALGALVLYLVVVSLTLQPTGWEAALLVLGGLVIAVIAGFGYGALRFGPLLRLYGDILKDVGETRGSKVSDGEGDH